MAKYRQCENVKFINPYHFVRVEKEKLKNLRNNFKDERANKGLTGYLVCKLTTLSPIHIPNTDNPDKNDDKQNTYDFFSYVKKRGEISHISNDIPVIPGSSLRGVIRSAYEAVTNSCMSTTDLHMPLYRRNNSKIFKEAGRLLLEEGKWKLIIADEIYKIRHRLVIKENLKENDVVYFSEETDIKNKDTARNNRIINEIKKERQDNDLIYGYLHKSGKYKPNYHRVFVFKDDDESEKIELEEKIVINLFNNYKLYRDSSVNNQYKRYIENPDKNSHNGYIEHVKNLNNIEDLNGVLVYFSRNDNNGKIELSPSQIGREFYEHTLEDILGELKPCTSKEALCPACSLFGFISADEALGSRIRVTDATYSGNIEGAFSNLYYKGLVWLDELASPKPVCSEFYLKKPEGAILWNYDHARKNSSEKDDMYIEDYKAEIKGRKFYWHHIKDASLLIDKNQENKVDKKKRMRMAKVRLLKEGVEFNFKIFFNNVSQEELNKLIWVLEIGGFEKNAHKIGKGKPLGLGSIKIDVEKIYVRNLESNDRIAYQIKEISKPHLDKIKELFPSKEIVSDFIRITKLNSLNDQIKYPFICEKRIDNMTEAKEEMEFREIEGNNYLWFMANRVYVSKLKTYKYIQYLKDVNNPVLFSYYKEDEDNENDKKKN